MKSITFVTGNKRKIAEAQSVCELFDIKVICEQYDIDEVQSHDPLKITLHKAQTAFALAKKPVVVNDAFWVIPALNGFPGGYMKDVAGWFTADDFIALMESKTDKTVLVTECVMYLDNQTTKTFTKVYEGKMSDRARGDGNSIEQVAIFKGKTVAEHNNGGKFSFEPEEQIWYDFAKWYSEAGGQ